MPFCFITLTKAYSERSREQERSCCRSFAHRVFSPVSYVRFMSQNPEAALHFLSVCFNQRYVFASIIFLLFISYFMNGCT